MPLNLSQALPEARRVLRLAWPVMLTSLNWTLMHLIDVAIVGHAGPEQLGALAAGRALTFITIVIGVASLSGIIVFTSRLDGAGQREQCGDVLRQGLLCAMALGMPTALAMGLLSVEITRAIGIAPEFVEDGAAVVRVMALAFPAQLLSATMAFFLEGVSRPGRAMAVNLAMLPLNAILAWAWVGGHFGLPASGAVGAVSATAVVSALGAAMMAFAVWTLPDARLMRVRDLSVVGWVAAIRGAPGLLRFGIVPGIASGLEMAGFSFLIALSTRLGAVATGAFQTVFSLHNFTFAVAIGMASAAGVRVGNAVGEQNHAQVLSRTLVAAGLLMLGMGAILLSYLLFAQPLVALFSDEPAVQALSVQMLTLWVPFTIFDGVQLIFVYALRSLGDQVAAGFNSILAFFVITGGLGWWLVIVREEGPFALVWAGATGMVAAALLQLSRFLWISSRLRPRTSD